MSEIKGIQNLASDLRFKIFEQVEALQEAADNTEEPETRRAILAAIFELNELI